MYARYASTAYACGCGASDTHSLLNLITQSSALKRSNFSAKMFFTQRPFTFRVSEFRHGFPIPYIQDFAQ